MTTSQERGKLHWAELRVRLHQPPEWYGVASRELSNDTCDATGFHTGMYGLASGAQVLERWSPHVAA